MKEDNPYKGITKKEIQEAVQEVFRTERKIEPMRWYKTLSTEQQKAVHAIFKAEVEAQLEKIEEKEEVRRNGLLLDEAGRFSVQQYDTWWNNPDSKMAKEWSKQRKVMNKKYKKYSKK